MKTKLIMLVAFATTVAAGGTVLFGENGLVDERSAALAELVPWKAPDAALRLEDEKVEHLGGGAYAIVRTVKNVGAASVSFKDELRVRDCFAADRYLIPCVNYNGNEFGAIKTPKGLSCEGQPWVFSYERTGVPSCTLTENGTSGIAVFAANDTKASLVSACSLEIAGRGERDDRLRSRGTRDPTVYEHVIVRPVTEAPYTYESKGVFGPRYDTYITLGAGKPEYVKFARGICDFFVAHWSEEWGFGKSWRVDGRPAAYAGTIGGFLIPALVELYDETNERKYLDAALKASDFYFKRDLDRFECTAGAIDCYCIDKETAWPFLNGSLSLYRITGDAKHLERAEKAAAYFTSWMFFFDGVYGPETDIAKHGWHTTGGTSVSAEHQGIDSWGSIAVPDLAELSERTGDAKWRRIAGLMWANAMQCITTRLGEFYHGQQRPIGSQSEACFQARFTKYRPVIEAGYFSDILAPWPSAFRMWTVERLRSKGIRMR